jgi:hypothetical protein
VYVCSLDENTIITKPITKRINPLYEASAKTSKKY